MAVQMFQFSQVFEWVCAGTSDAAICELDAYQSKRLVLSVGGIAADALDIYVHDGLAADGEDKLAAARFVKQPKPDGTGIDAAHRRVVLFDPDLTTPAIKISGAPAGTYRLRITRAVD